MGEREGHPSHKRGYTHVSGIILQAARLFVLTRENARHDYSRHSYVLKFDEKKKMRQKR